MSEEQFYSNLPHERNENSCWEWQGRRMPAGYGCVRAFGQSYAHRASYVAHRGDIPKGAHVLHKCDNPSCVNPAHLFLGDAKSNSDDKRQKMRKHRKITGAIAISIYESCAPTKDTAREYGVSDDLVYMIKSGRAWRDITGAPKPQTLDEWVAAHDAALGF